MDTRRWRLHATSSFSRPRVNFELVPTPELVISFNCRCSCEGTRHNAKRVPWTLTAVRSHDVRGGKRTARGRHRRACCILARRLSAASWKSVSWMLLLGPNGASAFAGVRSLLLPCRPRAVLAYRRHGGALLDRRSLHNCCDSSETCGRNVLSRDSSRSYSMLSCIWACTGNDAK